MYPTLKPKLTLLTMLLAWALTLTYASAYQEQGTVRFRVLTFERSSGLKKIFLGNDDGKAGEMVTMHKNNYTGPYTARSRNITFLRPAEANDDPPVVVGRVSLPESLGNRVLLIALPAAKSGYRFLPISDKRVAFKAGQIKFVNLTGVTVAGKLNAQKIKIAPHATSPGRSFSKEVKSHSFPVEFYYDKNKKWKPFSSSYWLHDPDVRSIVFFYLDPKTERLRIRSISETIMKSAQR